MGMVEKLPFPSCGTTHFIKTHNRQYLHIVILTVFRLKQPQHLSIAKNNKIRYFCKKVGTKLFDMTFVKKMVLLACGALSMPLTSCDGIFEDIYDVPTESQNSNNGFIHVDVSQHKGTVYVDASSYTRWMYIDFHKRALDSVNIVKGGEEFDGQWDLAVHRYDAKTHNGSVIETEFTDLEKFRESGKLPEGTFTEDVDTDSTIITDMSHMMDGQIGYAKSKVNVVLSKWLNRDMSTMPPIYTLSDKVYVVRFDDDTYAAVKLVNFMNTASVKGYLTIDYIYPVEF